MANCGAESLLRRLVVDKTSYIIYRVLNTELEETAQFLSTRVGNKFSFFRTDNKNRNFNHFFLFFVVGV